MTRKDIVLQNLSVDADVIKQIEIGLEEGDLTPLEAQIAELVHIEAVRTRLIDLWGHALHERYMRRDERKEFIKKVTT